MTMRIVLCQINQVAGTELEPHQVRLRSLGGVGYHSCIHQHNNRKSSSAIPAQLTIYLHNARLYKTLSPVTCLMTKTKRHRCITNASACVMVTPDVSKYSQKHRTLALQNFLFPNNLNQFESIQIKRFYLIVLADLDFILNESLCIYLELTNKMQFFILILFLSNTLSF